MKYFKFFVIFLCCVFSIGCLTPKGISVSKVVPPEVKIGDEFEFTVLVTNNDLKDRELRSIDVDKDFLEGFVVVKTTPEIKEEYDVFGQHIFEFRKPLAKQTTNSTTFRVKAVKVGDFSGDLDVCVDGDATCLFNSIRIVVK